MSGPVASEAVGQARAAQRLHGLTIISGALYAELKDIANILNAFAESPSSNPVSPVFDRLRRAAGFCGLWGVGNYLGGLAELAHGIESNPPLSVDRAQYNERVKTLAAGVNGLGLHLRDMNAGVSVSYTALNEQFAKVIRKSRPQMLELTAEEASPVLFMPAPPSLEVDALWTPAPGASHEALLAALATACKGALTEGHLNTVAQANPYHSLSGLFEVAASQHSLCASQPLLGPLTQEYTRLAELLGAGASLVPPAPDAFIFSRLLYALAMDGSDIQVVKKLRRRYSLSKPPGTGGPGVSMHDVAKKFGVAMVKFRDAYLQAALSNTPYPVKKLATMLLAEAHKLESPAFTTLAGALERLTQDWDTAYQPTAEHWVQGASLVLLMQEATNDWGTQEAQDELVGLADVMAATEKTFTSVTMQRVARFGAIQRACLEIQSEADKLKVAIEGALRSAGDGELSESQAMRLVENGGVHAVRLMGVICGFAQCVGLPAAHDVCKRYADLAMLPGSWSTANGRDAIYDGLTRITQFISRLRPGSLIDMQPDEMGQFAPVLPTVTDAVEMPVLTEIVESAEVVFDSQQDSQTLALAESPQGSGQGEPAAEVSITTDSEVVQVPVPTVEQTGCDDLAVDADLGAFDLDTFEVLGFDEPTSAAIPVESLVTSANPLEPQPIDLEELRTSFLSVQDGLTDELDFSDSELMRIMFEESEQCLIDILNALGKWSQGLPESALVGTVAEARRHIHTLKGVCRTCGLMAAGALLHALEDHLELMADDGIALAPAVGVYAEAMGVVRTRIEDVRTSFERADAGLAPAAAASLPTVFSDAVVSGPPGALLKDADWAGAPAAESPLGCAQSETSSEEEVGTVASDPPVAPVVAQPGVRSPALAPRGDVTVRVPVTLAARVGDASGQVLMASRRSLEQMDRTGRQLHELESNLKRMGPVLRELDILAAASIPSTSMGDSQGFDPLELDRYTALQELVRRLKEAFEDSVGSTAALAEGLRGAQGAEEERAQLSDELQRESSALMLVGVAAQRSRLERVVAKACEDATKTAELVIETACKVPAAALDKLMPVFEHLLRNAVAHGIEAGPARAAVGKAAAGAITIGLPLQGNADGSVVRIAVRDDGSGIDHARVLALAQKRGLVPRHEAYTPEAINEFLFMPGFSTASSVSELSGRGVGLDVVRAAVAALGGMVTVYSTPGRGTEFVLTLPTDSSSMSVVPVTSRGFKCLLPLTLVTRIVPISSGLEVDVHAGENKVTIAGVSYELIDFAARVPGAETRDDARPGRGHLVLMQETNVIKAVKVDAVGTQTRVVVRQLGPFVRDIPGMVAGTTMPGGEVGLVVNPLRLRDLSATQQTRKAHNSAAKHIMVVDDSSTVRLVTSRFLRRQGFEVSVASDGLMALQMLAKGLQPDTFLFDLEMPGMGGFELIAELRRKPQFEASPIIVISSRTAAKHRERAKQLGATAYLAKPYEDGQLLQLLESLMGLPA